MEPPETLTLRPEEIQLLLEELAEPLTQARVDKVFDAGETGFVLRLQKGRDRYQLLLSVAPATTRFHLIPESLSAPEAPSGSAMALRQQLKGARLVNIDQPGADRIIRFQFQRGGESATQLRSLVFELFGERGRLILMDSESRRIVWVEGRGGLRIGYHYRFPGAPKRASNREPKSFTLKFEPQKLIPPELRDQPFAFNFYLAERGARLESQRSIYTAVAAFNRKVKQERKRRSKLIDSLERDLAKASSWESWQQKGELLKAHFDRLEPGLAEVELNDYYQPEAPRVKIALDPKKSPQENVEHCFRRAQKGKRSLPQVESRLEEQRADHALLVELEASCQRVESIEQVTQLCQQLKRLNQPLPQNQPRRASGSTTTKRGPRPKRYRSREGLEIVAGRSAKENDRVTLSARGNDVFFHRADRPGPHVILKVPRSKAPAPESLEDAAFLAAYLSGWRGPGTALVHWTQAKYVRKPKGLPPGKVLISREREYVVKYRPELLERLVVRDSDASGQE